METCTSLSSHLSQWPVLRCCLPEGAGLAWAPERLFLLLLTWLEAVALSNPNAPPGHVSAPGQGTAPARVPPGTCATSPTLPTALPSGEAAVLSPCLPCRPGHEQPAAAPAPRQPSPEHWGWIQCQVPAEVVLGTGVAGSRSSLCREMCVFMCVCVCTCMPMTPNWFIYIFMHLNIASCVNGGCSTSAASVLPQTCYFSHWLFYLFYESVKVLFLSHR